MNSNSKHLNTVHWLSQNVTQPHHNKPLVFIRHCPQSDTSEEVTILSQAKAHSQPPLFWGSEQQLPQLMQASPKTRRTSDCPNSALWNSSHLSFPGFAYSALTNVREVQGQIPLESSFHTEKFISSTTSYRTCVFVAHTFAPSLLVFSLMGKSPCCLAKSRHNNRNQVNFPLSDPYHLLLWSFWSSDAVNPPPGVSSPTPDTYNLSTQSFSCTCGKTQKGVSLHSVRELSPEVTQPIISDAFLLNLAGAWQWTEGW